MNKDDFEERIIEGKKVRIKTVYQSHEAFAEFFSNTIIISEKTKNNFFGEKLDSILLHERGHFEFINRFLTIVLIAIILAIMAYLSRLTVRFLILNYTKAYWFIIYILTGLCLIIIAIWLFSWAKEILADWYSVKRTNKDTFRETLQEIYEYNKKVTKSPWRRFWNGVILHPPEPIRLKLIKFMENRRDKEVIQNDKSKL